VGGMLTPKQQNPMMTYDPQQGLQMPINQIDPHSLNPQALYAYQQMMAALQSGRGMNQQLLPPDIQARQAAAMQLYFPQMRNSY
jgi:hypothetical protein